MRSGAAQPASWYGPWNEKPALRRAGEVLLPAKGRGLRLQSQYRLSRTCQQGMNLHTGAAFPRKAELRSAWDRAQAGQRLTRIAPLE